MEKTTLIKRIEDKQTSIIKLEKRLDYYLSECSSEESNIIREFLLTGNKNPYRQWLKDNNKYYGSDAWSKAIDLYDARVTLLKYENMLKAITDRESVNKIDTIWQFLLQYKTNVINWLKDHAYLSDKYYRLDHEYCDMHNSRKYTIEQLNAKWLEVKEARDAIHPLVNKFYNVRRGWNDDELNKYMDKEIENRYFKLINQVTKYCDKIIDASNLTIRVGELNGIIKGTKQNVRIETIGAGGYNIQCFHYRTLVKPMR